MMDFTDHLILYHNDFDGFAAAVVAVHRIINTAFERCSPEPIIRAIPVQYDQPMPAIEDGTNLWIVDFSYPADTLQAVMPRLGSLHYFDHHKTSVADLAALMDDSPLAQPRRDVRHDMNESGATLMWKACFPDKPMPEILAHVRDRDLWLWELPDSKIVSRGMEFLFPVLRRDPTSPEAAELLRTPMTDFVRFGRLYDEIVQQDVKAGVQRSFPVNAFGYNCRFSNSPLWGSDICHEMLAVHPEIQVAVCFHRVDGGHWKYELRSRKGEVDVSAIAKAHGGGGHAAAAGFFSTRAPTEFAPNPWLPLPDGYDDHLPADMDPECAEVCHLLNRLPGLETTESCCGHGKTPFTIWFKCNDWRTISFLGRCTDSRYGCPRTVDIRLSNQDVNYNHAFFELRSFRLGQPGYEDMARFCDMVREHLHPGYLEMFIPGAVLPEGQEHH